MQHRDWYPAPSRAEPQVKLWWTLILREFQATYIKKWVYGSCNMLDETLFIVTAIYLIPLTIVLNIFITRCCRSLWSTSDSSILFYYTKVWILSEYYSNVWFLAVRHFGGIYDLIYDWKNISHGESLILVFLYFGLVLVMTVWWGWRLKG